jgi:hypothetical protein
MLVLALGSGAMQLPGVNVAAATKPKTAGQLCTANHLRVIPHSAFAVWGTEAFLVVLENVSKSNCTLEGYPQLRMLDVGGKSIATRVAHGSAFGSANFTGVTLISVKPGWSGLFGLTYPNSIDYPPATCPISDHVKIHIPNMKESIILKWRIQPYGGKTGVTPRCGEISVSFIYGPYRLTKSQLNNAA